MVPCIHCLRDTVKEAHLFSIETCQRAVIHNRMFLRCTKDISAPSPTSSHIPHIFGHSSPLCVVCR
jgi:hypothetical protein